MLALKKGRQLDCVVIGYNEIPFERYEQFLRTYGEDTEAYRDLKFSFINLAGTKLDYMGLLNHVLKAANKNCGDLKSGDIPNLAAVYLMNFLLNRGVRAKYINLFQQEKEKLIEYLAEDPAVVAITTTFYVVNMPVIEMVDFIRRHNSKVKIVVGGPLIANHSRNEKGQHFKTALDDMGADVYVIEGQGEQTLYHIVNCVNSGADLNSVPNIAYVENGQLVRTKPIPENNSMDENFINWRVLGEPDLGRTIQTRTARSCAFNCAFCNYPTRAGKLSLAGLDTLEKEFDSIRQMQQVSNVVFIDDTFNVPLPRFKELCRMLIDKQYGFNWYSYFRCSNSDEEAMDLMARSGCKGVFLGIESGSPTILKNMNKAATVEKYSEGIRLLRERGILTFGSFIVGFPGETEETVKETEDFIRETKPDYYRAQMWYCEPGTPIDQQRSKYDIKGEGFVWSHATMDSLEAMDLIEKMFLTLSEIEWLPQWSFDFWIIPYLAGKGINVEKFRGFMHQANRLLAMNVATLSEQEQNARQREYVENLIDMVKGWDLTS
jgi:radical SAM PhpK family P-methyltransferase